VCQTWLPCAGGQRERTEVKRLLRHSSRCIAASKVSIHSICPVSETSSTTTAIGTHWGRRSSSPPSHRTQSH
jgi:hypothetical protein